MPTTKVQIDSNPSPTVVLAARKTLLLAGISPDNRDDVVSLATYGVFPLDVVTACAQLVVTFDCPLGCGRKLDPSDKDALGVELCPRCYYEAGLENEHSDGLHEERGEYNPDCPDCQERGK